MFDLFRRRSSLIYFAALIVAVALLAGCAAQPGSQPGAQTPQPANPDLILATTTSTQDSGLLDVLIPMFEQQTGYRVKTIAVGTGQALALGERGEADVLLVHAPEAEKEVVAKGAAINRTLVMHNDFVLVGPPADPAAVEGNPTAAAALAQIAAAAAIFISRGDDSGTHKKELSLWQAAGVQPQGIWYQETGAGMGQTLRVAAEKEGYTLTDRATYLANRHHLGLEIVVEGDAPLLNIYHVMQTNHERFDKVNAAGAAAFVQFLVSEPAQAAIAAFGVDQYGQPLFFPDAGQSEEQLLKQN